MNIFDGGYTPKIKSSVKVKPTLEGSGVVKYKYNMPNKKPICKSPLNPEITNILRYISNSVRNLEKIDYETIDKLNSIIQDEINKGSNIRVPFDRKI